MPKQTITTSEIIQMTIENVRSFYSRDKNTTTSLMTKDFMWIGSNDFQWCEGLEEFYKVTKNEYEEPPVLLSDEEYHLLFHERNVWVVYGRYHATAFLEDGSIIHAHVRGTYVWRKIDGVMKLAHVHGSHAQDIPLNQMAPSKTLTANSNFFDHMKQMDTLNADASKIAFHDRDGMHRFLLPDEILYLKASGQFTIVYTKTTNFTVYGLLSEIHDTLPSHFRRIQKSYLVNTHYIEMIYRYTAVLKDGQELPIGRNWYMELKQFLKDQIQ